MTRLTIDEAEALAACVFQADQQRVDDHVIAVGCKPVNLDDLYEKVCALNIAWTKETDR